MNIPVQRGDVYWVNLDPTVGKEVKKRRPAVVVSPNEMNRSLAVVIVAPITSSSKPWPTRVDMQLSGKPAQMMLDQIRTVDKFRLVRRIGTVEVDEALSALQIMFAY